MIRQKRGPSGPVSYQHKRRPRSTLLVSKVQRLARTAQGGRQKGRKLGESGREGVEGRRGFIVADRHRYTDIEDYLVGLTLGQVRSFDARGRSPHVRSSRPPIVGPRGRGSLPRLPCYCQGERGADKMPGKRVQFDDETWHALDLLARDRMMDFQELADEAFSDLLKKHGRPTDLKTALRESVKKEHSK